MQPFHIHGNLAHDIGHNLLIAVLMVQQLGLDTTMTIVSAVWRRHA